MCSAGTDSLSPCFSFPDPLPDIHSVFQETVFRPAVPPSCRLRVRYLPLHLYPYLPLPPTLASLPSASSALGAFTFHLSLNAPHALHN